MEPYLGFQAISLGGGSRAGLIPSLQCAALSPEKA